jgi:lipopolysaccharide/colanic/teichoic acid biosynthesis glycosyltransferase
MEQQLISVRQTIAGRRSEPAVESTIEPLVESREREKASAQPDDHKPDVPLYLVTTPGMGYFFAKRLIDIVGSLIGLILLAPVFLILAITVKLDSAGPVFHRRRVLAKQPYRSGKLQTFDAFKFRTMITNADEFLQANPHLLREYQKEFKLVEDPRVTRIGVQLRRSSLDELPQLFNILMGQMSLVGPRMITEPELVNYEMEGPQSASRLLSVKPGLTGLWQVSGRTNIPYKERVRLDMEYIESRTLLLDIQILIRTVGCVLRRRGAV